MITAEKLLSTEKEELAEAAKELTSEDLAVLVDWLSEKDDKIRYQALLLLQSRIKFSGDVCCYWNIFRRKLKSGNYYQRSIGIIMIAGNVKWDKDQKFNELFEEYFTCLEDEKPITVRQCIQSLSEIIPYTEGLREKIGDTLMAVDLLQVRETMRKLIQQDILDALMLIRKYQKSEKIDHYISDALTGNILDKKAKKRLEAML